MKKRITITLSMLITLIYISKAQGTEHAIGLRFGGNNAFGTEISYQKTFSDQNRGEADMGLFSGPSYSEFILSGVYQWTFPMQNSFSWFIGPGVQLGSWGYKTGKGYNTTNSGGYWLAIIGQIGIEYKFDFPLQIGVDFRPGLAIGNPYNDVYDIGVSARYTF